MNYDWGQTAAKKKKKRKERNLTTLNSAHQAKKKCNFDSGWLEQ